MKNQEIAAVLYNMADILEMQDVAWKPRAYRTAARAIDNLSEPIELIFQKGGIKALEELPGVGEGIGKKIVQYIETGKVDEYEKLKKLVPKHIDILMKIPGIGPKKVKMLSSKLKIKTVAQLEKAAKTHKISGIPGFKEKSEQDIIVGIALMKKSKTRIPLKQAEKEADRIITVLKKEKAVEQITVAGSMRRKKPTVGDIDILVSSKNPHNVIDKFTNLKEIDKVLVKGETRAAVVLKSGTQVDLRVLPSKSWGSGLLYFTGSKNYNIQLRKIAIKHNWKLNEYGLFDKKTGKMIAGKTEEDVCKKLGVPFLTPEQREM
jgi:DNA polymerase (family 10)